MDFDCLFAENRGDNSIEITAFSIGVADCIHPYGHAIVFGYWPQFVKYYGAVSRISPQP